MMCEPLVSAHLCLRTVTRILTGTGPTGGYGPDFDVMALLRRLLAA
jgi:hypothetical protein